MIGSRPFLRQLPRKMSANEVLMTARKPKPISAHGACSRELPQPKLSPGDQIVPPSARGWLRMNSGFGEPSAR
jgi:hypothetical protein